MNELARHGTDILLVLLDIVMPDMNGFEVLSQMGAPELDRRYSRY